jgi:hypothetical protein
MYLITVYNVSDPLNAKLTIELQKWQDNKHK